MPRPTLTATLLAAALVIPPALAPAPSARAMDEAPAAQRAQDALPLQRVTLYSSGVGYFEHTGPIAAGASPTFRFTDGQLNDVLKSLLVRGASGAVAVDYPGQEPVDQRLAGFGIDLSHVDSLEDVLKQLRGIELDLTLSGNQTVAGKLIGVNPRTRIHDDVQITEHLITLATDAGLQRLTLDQVDAVAINDDALNAELQKALALLGSTRRRDAKPLTLNFADASEQVAVSYLLETPLWKLTYRLDLSQDEPLLQAWAIVDNTTDSDWEDINISLVSGRPVSFVQNLYAPEYLARPVVQPERFAGLRPQTHALGREVAGSVVAGLDMAMGLGDNLEFGARGLSPQRARVLQSVSESAAVPATPAPAFANSFDALGAQVTAAAGAADLGSLFAYHLDQPVTLQRGQSAMLPILNADIKVGPVSVYNQQTQRKHPMLGVSVRNTTDLKLDAGPVTVLDDGAYAGDAQLGFLAPGDARLLTYGLDLEVTVDASQKNKTELVTAKISRGVLELTHATQYTHTYEARNAVGQTRQLLVEHPRINGRELIEPRPQADAEKRSDEASETPAPSIEKTENHYRFPLSVEAGQTGTLTVVERQPRTQRVQLVQQAADQLAVYARNGDMPKDVREALTRAVHMQRELEATRQQIEDREQRVAAIDKEQDRIRDNMARLDRNNALYKRYVEKLDAQETQLEQIGGEAEDLREKSDAQLKALNAYLESLDVE
ncbi:MAG: DUF4139 domain-containing protein [Planctomycetota bacterium]